MTIFTSYETLVAGMVRYGGKTKKRGGGGGGGGDRTKKMVDLKYKRPSREQCI